VTLSFLLQLMLRNLLSTSHWSHFDNDVDIDM
jgi:hypothetical protein